MKKNNLIFVIAASFFSIVAVSVLVAKAATTWQGPPSNCTSPSTPGCNVDGVIWNTDQPQAAKFNITGKGIMGGGLEINDNSIEVKKMGTTNFTIDNQGGARNNYIELEASGDLRMEPGKGINVKLPGGSSLLNIGNWAPGGTNVDVTIYGNLKLRKDPLKYADPQICFDDTDPATCRTTWPSGGGFTQAQADLLYVKKAGDTMTGDLSAPSLYANTTVSAGNNVVTPTLYLQKSGQTSNATLNNNFWTFAGDLGFTQFQPTFINMLAKTSSGANMINLDMRSLGNFNTTIGQVLLGDLDNAGYFLRNGGGKSAYVNVLSNTGGETWATMTGLSSNVPNAAGNYAGIFSTTDNARKVFLVGPTYALEVKGDANFQNQICLGGSCKNTWPTGTITAVTGSNGVASTGGTAPNLTLNTVFTDGRYLLLNGGNTLTGNLGFGSATRQMMNLWGTIYGIGVQADTQYYRTNNYFAWYKGGVHNDAAFNAGGGTVLMKLDNLGNLTIGTGTTGCLKDADGTIISGTCASDSRLKKNIQPLSNVLDQYVKLQPVNFTWRETGKTDTGLIAQEVEKVFPNLVEKSIDGYKSVSYNVNLQMLGMQAIKELKTENDALKAKNHELERRLDILENKLK